MLVLESLEKAEVEVADELLGEAFSWRSRFLSCVSGLVSPVATPAHTPTHEATVLSQGFLQQPLPPSCAPTPGGLLWAL